MHLQATNDSAESQDDSKLIFEPAGAFEFINEAWRVDETHAFERQVGATDDMRYAMSLNPHMNVFITHGIYDLVTPYFSTDRLIEHMRLTSEQRERLTVQHFNGGHMFYAWEKSRIAFFAAMSEFFSKSI